MHEVFALLRASWLTASSYRLSWVISLGSLLLAVVPLYFVANALQPVMADTIRTEGGQYFAFVLVGVVAYSFLGSAAESLPGAVGGGITTGTLEALLGTPTPIPVILAGLTSYRLCWTAARAALLLSAGALFGARLEWEQLPIALAILVLIILAYLPVGLVAAALVLTFRTSGPLTKAVLTLSVLLGGVYYPTHVIPSWIERISAVVPLTYGLRALRRTLLEGMPLSAVAADVAILCVFVVVLLALGMVAFSAALRHARRAGTLGQY
ncbi:MAG TPA: ABC transporter permease [Longimicrobiaceae bacterium]